MVSPFSAYRGLPVLVTGHTGFKGGWLCEWLLALGAEVTGLSLPPDRPDGLHACLRLGERVRERFIDVRDTGAVAEAIASARPAIVFHLAAQPLVRRSYEDPGRTWQVNVVGTTNVLDAVRACPSVRAAVVVTTDKCYENREWTWGYREIDRLGGHDPYSASKAAAELAVASYRRSFCRDGTPRLASARAGNVIGGGDWSTDRIVTDFIAAMRAGRPLRLRNPAATRPWQHVLEPLSGYLALGQRLLGSDGCAFAEAWNFGPSDAGVATVERLARALVAAWGSGSIEADASPQPHEARLLALDCAKASQRLGWRGALGFEEAVTMTVDWYRAHASGADVAALTRQQIERYSRTASTAGAAWAASTTTDARAGSA